jgi:low affinity Fe/Cu permease
MTEEKKSQHVCRIDASDYGDKYADHLLEQYKLFVQMADQISARRATANNYFLAVNSLLVALSGALPALTAKPAAWQVVIPVAGIILCATWLVLIRSYRTMNTAKFKVIHEN